jgi:hypothetical protein
MTWAGHVALMGQILVVKPEGKRHLGSPRRRWEDNIKKYEGKKNWRFGLNSSGSG